MPRLQDIELFKRDLSTLAHEAEVLERWGEKPEAIAPPEGAGAAPEAAAPEPARTRAPALERKPAAEAPSEEETAPPDFAALLDGLPLEPEGGDEAAAESSSLDDDLAALLGDFGGAGKPPAAASPETTAPEAGAPEESTAAPESFELPPEPAEPFPAEPSSPGDDEFAMPDFGAEPPAGEGAGTMPEEAKSAESAGSGGAAESFDFTMPDLGEAAKAPSAPEEGGLGSEVTGEEAAFPAEAQAAEAQGAAAEGAGDDFSIPDFDLAEEREEEPTQAGESDAAEDFGADFSIPDIGGESSGGAAAELAESRGASEPAEADFGTDAFESFTFEEPDGAPEPGLSDFGAGGPSQDLDTEIAALSEEAPVADTFKLDQDWGGFGGFGGETAREPPPRAAPTPLPAAKSRAEEAKFKPVRLSEAQVDRLQDALLSYPLNLRVAIEDIIANAKGTDAQQSELVWLLVGGATAEEAASLAGRILKRHIPVPKGAGKRTGAALEARKGSLAYAFIHTFLPAIKIGLLVLAATAAVGYLGWRYVYIPLAADSLYRTGYRRIAEDRYPEAETDFAKATAMKEYISWYYRYAEAYAAKRQYLLAEQKYSSLVAAHPKEKRGILEWAKLEKDQLKYEEAVNVLKGAPRSKRGEATKGMTGLLSWDYFNKEGLLLLGDVYLDWGEESPEKYEEARRTYAMLLERYGEEEVYLERMLLYFIRVDKLKEVLPLKAHFLADPKKSALSARVLAELGGYLLDKDRLDDVRDILLSAAKKDPSVPEAHYNLARYFRRSGDPAEERKALDNAVRTFAELPARRVKQAGMFIDSLIWRGRFLADAGEWVSAEKDYARAAEEYESALELRRVATSGRFAEAYAGLGDVAYQQSGDQAAALAYYDRAEAGGYVTADTCYRRGNILYNAGRFADALEKFYGAQGRGGSSPYLDYALASAFRARNDFFAAEAYYRRVSAAMAKQLEDIVAPAPQERPSEIEVLGLYLKSENNLGVALYRSAARSGDARRRNEAMAAFARSARLYDQLSQEPAALQESPEPQNLALANIDSLVKSGGGEDLRSYIVIEKDFPFPRTK